MLSNNTVLIRESKFKETMEIKKSPNKLYKKTLLKLQFFRPNVTRVTITTTFTKYSWGRIKKQITKAPKTYLMILN